MIEQQRFARALSLPNADDCLDGLADNSPEEIDDISSLQEAVDAGLTRVRQHIDKLVQNTLQNSSLIARIARFIGETGWAGKSASFVFVGSLLGGLSLIAGVVVSCCLMSVFTFIGFQLNAHYQDEQDKITRVQAGIGQLVDLHMLISCKV